MEDEMGGTCSTHGKYEEVKTFIGKPKEKRILESPNHRRKDTSKVSLKNISYEDVD